MTNQAKLILEIRSVAQNIQEYGHLAYHIELADSVDDNNFSFYTEYCEKEMVKMMKLIKKYNDNHKELVKWLSTLYLSRLL